MKMSKILFSSLLFVAAFQANPAQAKEIGTTKEIVIKPDHHLPVYQNTIAAISLDYEDSLLIGSIKLDNGLVLRIVDYKTRDDNVMKTWSVGDVVSFDPKVKNDTLILTMKREGQDTGDVEAIAILDVTKEPRAGLYVVDVTEEGKYVKLSDGSSWHFSWVYQFTTSKWKHGEHVLVQGNGKGNGYDFINLDAPVQDKVHHAKGLYIF